MFIVPTSVSWRILIKNRNYWRWNYECLYNLVIVSKQPQHLVATFRFCHLLDTNSRTIVPTNVQHKISIDIISLLPPPSSPCLPLSLSLSFSLSLSLRPSIPPSLSPSLPPIQWLTLPSWIPLSLLAMLWQTSDRRRVKLVQTRPSWRKVLLDRRCSRAEPFQESTHQWISARTKVHILYTVDSGY